MRWWVEVREREEVLEGVVGGKAITSVSGGEGGVSFTRRVGVDGVFDVGLPLGLIFLVELTVLPTRVKAVGLKVTLLVVSPEGLVGFARGAWWEGGVKV